MILRALVARLVYIRITLSGERGSGMENIQYRCNNACEIKFGGGVYSRIYIILSIGNESIRMKLDVIRPRRFHCPLKRNLWPIAKFSIKTLVDKYHIRDSITTI